MQMTLSNDQLAFGPRCAPDWRSIRLLAGLSVLFSALGVESAWAQEASIRGVVSDESKAVIAGADITLTNLDTKVTRKAVTDGSGFYQVPLLKEGRYQVHASISGFQSKQAEVRVEVGQIVQLDFQLQVGKISDMVEVQSSADRIQQQPYNVGTVVEEKQIRELPLNGRNYLSLANLSPGILRGGSAGRGEQSADEGGFRSGGLPMDMTAILVDGVDNASRTVQGPLITQAQTLKPAVEAISEFKVVTNNVSAEYGYKAGAQVLVSTKSGTNQFHGDVYEFHRNAAVAANNFMFNRDGPRDPNTNELTEKKPPYIRNQFGATLGGPVFRDKTFFFVSFQGTRLREGGDSFLQSVPSPLARQGDFSRELNIGNAKNAIYDPMTLSGTGTGAVRQQFANNRIPQSRWDPAAAKLLELFPLPNVPGNDFGQFNFFWVQRNRNDNEVYDARIDHNFNSNNRVFGRYSFRHEDSIAGAMMPFPSRASNIALYTGHQVAVNYNATLNSKSHNELRGGFTHFPAARTDEHTENLNQAYGIPNAAVDQFPDLIKDEFENGLAFFFFGGGNRFSQIGGGSGGGTNTTNLDTFYLADNFLVDRGKHSLKFGGEYRRWRSNRTQGNIFGTMNFDGRYTAQFPNDAASRNATGHTIADFLLGMTMDTANGLPVGEDLASPYYGVYLQDDWRVTPRLTINMGLRWELFKQPSHVRFDPTTPVARAIFSGNLYDETSAKLPIRFEGWDVPDGEGDCGCKLDKKNWGPRLGIAYRLFQNTVIRAGGGIYYSENGTVQLEANRFLVGGPNVVSASSPQGFETTTVTISGGFPSLSLEGRDPNVLQAGAAPTIVPEFLPTTSSAQWFLDIQHQLPWNVLVTLGYNGQAQSHIQWWNRNVGAPLEPGTLPFNNPARIRIPAPGNLPSATQVNFILLNENILNANYHAFTSKVEKRFSKGVSFIHSFTWSKALDYGVSSLNERGEGIGAGRGGQPPSQFLKDLWMNYGPSGLSRDFAYNASVLYEVPLGAGKGRLQSGPASWILGGWQVGAILQMQSGPFVTNSFTVNNANTYGPYRGNLTGNPNLPESERDSTRWFDDSVFVLGPPGQYGNAGRGTIESPGWKNLDFLASKNFPMPWEGHRLQFRFEAFNFTNTPHLGAPSTDPILTSIPIGNPNATRIIRADEPRIVQFALKYSW